MLPEVLPAVCLLVLISPEVMAIAKVQVS